MTTAPTSARRAAPELTSAERKALRALAHHLDPVVTVGDAGLTPAVLAETGRALTAHGLIKIRVHGDDRERRLAILAEICSTLGCAPVQAIGKLLVVWREKPETGTGGDAGTARRRPGRQTKKAAGAGQKASVARRAAAGKAAAPAKAAAAAGKTSAAGKPAAPARAPAKAPSRARPAGAATVPGRKAPAKAKTAAKGRAPARAGAGPAAASGLTRSARPGSGTRARRRAP
ncbi:YhbY family RNA-binding protein [Zeimonas arvi]|uniref:YhbY family RNA-binding protein n=1 Tax=Zeimonas arvi TaxID=2498847 RepID=A0A5C8NQI4_9BURK|nr:YhbY family RNA-binding protein [Zeimonas arvi]TXL63508.1 YhbY family RNA-binding protein [Zeimonas arvi]